MQLFTLPEEIIDEIIDHLFDCSEHPQATRTSPCFAKHAPIQHSRLTPLRLVNRYFNAKLNIPIFQHISCKGPHRHLNLVSLSQTPSLTNLIHTLRIEVCPRDFGKAWSDEIHGYPAGDRAEYYFDDLKRYLVPPLSRMRELHTLYLTMTYSGLHLAGISRGQLLMPCFEALCAIIREARLPRLEVVQIGVPYEGGYAGFFQDKGCRRILEGIKGGCWEKDRAREWEVPKLRKASVKLCDWKDNYTIMDFILGD